ncbi:MAG: NfeD family protein [Rhodothermales bacterium]
MKGTLHILRAQLTALVVLLACTPALAQQAGKIDFPEPLGAGPAYIVPIDETIDAALASYIDRATSEAEEAGASVIVYHVDTFGGLVDAADQIRKTILNTPIPTVAFIDKNAASAGALISYAADRIVMAPGASIGAATVVEGGSGKKAAEKYQSYMRGLMRATAEANGRDPRVAEAMVDDSLEVEGISKAGELLTLSTREALRIGVADAEMEDLPAVLAALGIDESRRFDHHVTGTEKALRFLGSPVLQSLLMLMMMGGLYFELQSPGVGFAGLMAGVGAALFFAPNYMMGLVESWEIVLFGIGVILLLAEIFVIPGFGVAGITGLILIVGSLFAALVGNVGLAFPDMASITSAIGTMAITMVLLVVLIFSLGRILPQSQRFNRLVLAPELTSADGYTSADTHEEWLGAVGRALTPLRPAGTVELSVGEMARRVDVVTSGEYIPAGSAVRVVQVRGSRVEVQPVTSLAEGNETSRA